MTQPTSDVIELTKAGVTTRIMPGGAAMFSFSSGYAQDKGVAPSEKRKYTLNGDWVKWGNDNNFPEHVMRALSGSTVAKRIIDHRASVHVGAGLIYYTIDIEGGKRVKRPLYIPEIEDFMEASNALTVQKQYATDLETFFNGMPMLYPTNKNDGKVGGYGFKKMFASRMGKPSETSGKVKNIVWSHNWPNPRNSKDKINFRKYPIYNPIDGLKDISAVPLRYNTSDECLYYELAIWDSVRTNGWMEIEAMVPKLKKHIFSNQAILKYHVEIPYTYWEIKYGKATWAKLDVPEKEKLIEKEMVNMDKFLSGTENSGKSFISMFAIDAQGKAIPGFKITALDNKLKSDDYLPDANAATTAICFAMGYDPTGLGSTFTDKRGSSGSGSDKRETLANLQAGMGSNRYVTLEIPRIITRINGWNQIYKEHLNDGKGRIHWGYLDVDNSQTMNQVTPSERTPGQSKNETVN